MFVPALLCTGLFYGFKVLEFVNVWYTFLALLLYALSMTPAVMIPSILFDDVKTIFLVALFAVGFIIPCYFPIRSLLIDNAVHFGFVCVAFLLFPMPFLHLLYEMAEAEGKKEDLSFNTPYVTPAFAMVCLEMSTFNFHAPYTSNR